MTRSVDQVDLINVTVVVPECGGGGGSDGDTSLLLLNHPVHCGSPFMYLTDLVSLSGVVQNTLGCSRLAGIDVSHDADVSCVSKISFSSHLRIKLETEVGECLVGLSHLVHILFSLECTTLVIIGGNDLCTKFFCHRVAGTLAGEVDHVLH